MHALVSCNYFSARTRNAAYLAEVFLKTIQACFKAKSLLIFYISSEKKVNKMDQTEGLFRLSQNPLWNDPDTI